MPEPSPTPSTPPAPLPAAAAVPAAGWGPWLALTWLLVVLTCAVAELAGLENLQLALDLQRHLAR
ncbi:MAG: hypothetical protein ACKOSS_04725 [Planctomycetia bacterium]